MKCAYCGKPAEGNYSIHRDGMALGPEVELCNQCGKTDALTCEVIWDRIRIRGPVPLRVVTPTAPGEGDEG